jgi:hypothetical protein
MKRIKSRSSNEIKSSSSTCLNRPETCHLLFDVRYLQQHHFLDGAETRSPSWSASPNVIEVLYKDVTTTVWKQSPAKITEISHTKWRVRVENGSSNT